MEDSKVGLAIRTAFNNQGWSGRCKNPFSDSRCSKCVQGKLFINWGKPIGEDENGYCKGNPIDYPLSISEEFWCWEQVLCTKFFWGNVIGKWRNVTPGMPVYFFYKPDSTYTLWGHSTIERIDNMPDRYPPIYFKPFNPLPENKRVRGLTDISIVGKSWRQLHFRYLDVEHERYLASLIKGGSAGVSISPPSQMREHYENFDIQLRQDIKEKIQRIAIEEGRDIGDLIREAIAKLIRERGGRR